jgi:hypothetical protein
LNGEHHGKCRNFKTIYFFYAAIDSTKQLPPFSAVLGNADVIGIIIWTLSGIMWHAPQPYGGKPAWGRG